MSVLINEVGIVVPGSVTRKYDSEANHTVLTVNAEQASSIAESLGPVLSLLGAHGGTPATPPPFDNGGLPPFEPPQSGGRKVADNPQA